MLSATNFHLKECTFCISNTVISRSDDYPTAKSNIILTSSGPESESEESSDALRLDFFGAIIVVVFRP